MDTNNQASMHKPPQTNDEIRRELGFDMIEAERARKECDAQIEDLWLLKPQAWF